MGRKPNNKSIVIVLLIIGLVLGAFVYGVKVVQKNNEEEQKQNEKVSESLKEDSVAEIFHDKKPDTIHPSTYKLFKSGEYNDTVSKVEFEKLYVTDKPTVFYFYSSECGHCQNFTPVLNQVAKEQGVNIVKHNLLEYPEDYDTYQIEATPTLTYRIGGKEKERVVGDIGYDGATQFLTDFKADVATAQEKEKQAKKSK